MDSPLIDTNIFYNINALSADQFNDIKNKIEKVIIEKNNANCKPLFRHQLTAEEWQIVDEYAKKLNEDYNYRIKMMLKRFEVTFESFLWSNRFKKNENGINKFYLELKKVFEDVKPIGLDDLIGANTDLLIIDKTSSSSLRETTKNEFSKFIVKDKPMDRGGRTTEINPLPTESFKQQQQQQQQSNFHNNKNSTTFFKQYQNQRNNHIENQVRQQYQNDSSNNDGYSRSNSNYKGSGNRGDRGHNYEKRKRNF